ncbi:TPA: hypothetical protein ACG1XR_005209, partial [Escherichia coli]
DEREPVSLSCVLLCLHLQVWQVIFLPACKTDAYLLITPRFYVSTSKSIIKALINMHSFEIQLSPIG